MNRGRAEAALALNTVAWGATFVLVKAALGRISPMLFLAFRFGLATAVLLPLWATMQFLILIPWALKKVMPVRPLKSATQSSYSKLPFEVVVSVPVQPLANPADQPVDTMPTKRT